jgi:CheY-like chemotaxis protein
MQANASKKLTILVAEDDDFQRETLSQILKKCEYEVVAVEDGKKAMDRLKTPGIEFDLVLLDLYMPEMDGFEVLSLMKEDEILKHIPIVVMSSMESNDIISNCLKMGAMNYLVKPLKL